MTGNAVPEDAVATGLREVITTDYLSSQAVAIVDDIFNVIEGRDDVFNLSLDITPIKAALRGEQGDDFARALAGALPQCEAGQEPVAPDGTVYRCVPPGTSVEDVAQTIEERLPTWLESAPDTLVLTEQPLELYAGDFNQAFDMTPDQALRTAVVALVAVTAVFGLITALIGGRGVRGLLQWLGWMLLIPAALVLLFGLGFASDIANNLLQAGINEVQFQGVEASGAFRGAMLDTTRDALGRVSGGFITAGGIASAIGLVLVVLGLLAPGGADVPDNGQGRGFVSVPSGSPDKPKHDPRKRKPPQDVE